MYLDDMKWMVECAWRKVWVLVDACAVAITDIFGANILHLRDDYYADRWLFPFAVKYQRYIDCYSIGETMNAYVWIWNMVNNRKTKKLKNCFPFLKYLWHKTNHFCCSSLLAVPYNNLTTFFKRTMLEFWITASIRPIEYSTKGNVENLISLYWLALL